jgi:uroporphyrin-III C-methyltransferase/precorrin-2 dehydrogenase/sirohydrochlorin ferrochelatase
MGLSALPILCRELVRHGLARDTAAAVVQSGTRQDQRVLTASIDTLAERAAAAGMRSPALVIVGDVVRVREQVLASFAPARDEALRA